MKSTVKKYRLPLIFIILTLVISLSIVLIYSFIKINNLPDKQIIQFNDVLNNRFDQNSRLLKDISTKFPNPEFQEVHSYSNKLPKFISLYILEHGKLIYWSDNTIPVIFPIGNKRIIETKNGYFQHNSLKQGPYEYVLLDLIKYHFPYQNDYLVSSYNPLYSLPSYYEINNNASTVKIVDKNGVILFGITPSETFVLSAGYELLLYTLSLLVFVLVILAIYYYSRAARVGVFPSLIIMYMSAVLLRIITFIYDIPRLFESFSLFNPINYASSPWLPSLGDLLTNTLIVALLNYIVFRTLRNREIKRPNTFLKILYSLLCLVSLTFFYYLSLYLNDTLIMNSSFELNLAHILDFSAYSIIAYFIMAMILLSFFFASFILVRVMIKLLGEMRFIVIMLVFNSLIWYWFKLQGLYIPEWQELILFFVYMALLVAIFARKLPFPHVTTTSLLILVLTTISAFCLYHNKESKEIEERKLMTLRLSSDQDKIAEYLFTDIETSIMNDSSLHKRFMNAWYDPSKESECVEYIQNHYFNGFWTKYNAQITLCYPDKQLVIKPSNIIMECTDYFTNIINNITAKTTNKTLFYIRESYGTNSYIARLPINNKAFLSETANIIIELTQKYVPKGLGYPELLLDKSFMSFYDMSIYSYAIYSNEELIKNVGDYYYSISEKPFLEYKKDYNYFDKNGYNHLYHTINDKTSIIISKKNETLLDKLSPFTYQLIFHIILIFLLKMLYNIRFKREKYPVLKTQLQIMLVALVLFSSIIIGFTTLHNIRSLNNKKNQDMLSEKAHSVLIEVEHKLATYNNIDSVEVAYLQELLTKFSLVFFSDINLYTVEGKILASSRQEIFEEGLRSNLMTSEAFNELSVNQRTFFITNEQIGKYKYLSAYIPFRNDNNKKIAFINLPYFAREHELRQEISSFLVTFVNVYIILTAIAVFISLVVGNYVTRPLQLIRDQFSTVKLDKKNEKITYNRNDELGNLINEYNTMLDKLSDSVDKLAQSERESAWKEMAQQIAHEIKNPLTPMKLSIQHLYKSWKDNTPDWEQRLAKTTTSLIQQIDSLAAIASAFSDFAKFPIPSNEKVELVQLIKDTIPIFIPQTEYTITFNHPDKPCYTYADPKQLSRVMVNLINNSIQAIPVGLKGKIVISIVSLGADYHILIADNGIGIPEEQKQKIFSPNFTTKSGGTGLGLAMVKNIIDSINGSISFSSNSNGTTFTICLPSLNIDND